jgi:NAD(P)H-dependent flavin oxidoreductase YrpB (nitropropane dioxygenase family)
MNVAAGPELAAAVTNAGGLGVIGGIGYIPKILRQQVRIMPSCQLSDPSPTFQMFRSQGTNAIILDSID